MEVERPEDDVSKAFYLPPSDFFFHIRQRESSSPSSRVETGWDGTGQERALGSVDGWPKDGAKG